MPPRRNPQMALLNDERPVPVFAQVPTSQLVFTEQEVTPSFVESIERLGVLQPLVVIRAGRAKFNVVAGRRRSVAALRLGLETVPAMVFPIGTSRSRAAAIAISENNQRRPNVVTDLLAIENLLAAGHSERQIADDLSLPISTIRARLRLRAIPTAIREALDRGAIAVTVAEAVARLDPVSQQRVAALLTETGQVTMAAVRDARTVAVDEQLAVLEEVLPPAVVQQAREAAESPEPLVYVLRRAIRWEEGTLVLDAETATWPAMAEALLGIASVIPTDDLNRADQMVALLDEAVRLAQDHAMIEVTETAVQRQRGLTPAETSARTDRATRGRSRRPAVTGSLLRDPVTVSVSAERIAEYNARRRERAAAGLDSQSIAAALEHLPPSEHRWATLGEQAATMPEPLPQDQQDALLYAQPHVGRVNRFPLTDREHAEQSLVRQIELRAQREQETTEVLTGDIQPGQQLPNGHVVTEITFDRDAVIIDTTREYEGRRESRRYRRADGVPAELFNTRMEVLLAPSVVERAHYRRL